MNLGGSLVCDAAIASGSLDAYVEYSGTALTAILHQPLQQSRPAVNDTVTRAYAKRGLHWGPNLGFNDTFAMIVRRNSGLRTISDLKRVEATFQPGFGYEFASRPDGWPVREAIASSIVCRTAHVERRTRRSLPATMNCFRRNSRSDCAPWTGLPAERFERPRQSAARNTTAYDWADPFAIVRRR